MGKMNNIMGHGGFQPRDRKAASTTAVGNTHIKTVLLAFKSPFKILRQNGGAILAHAIYHNEECRDAVIAQMDDLRDTLLAHLATGEVCLIHNAALILGICCSSSKQFRQCFWPQGKEALVALVESHLTSLDSGLLCNLVWAMRTLVEDSGCAMCSDMASSISVTVTKLVGHSDMRICVNARAILHALDARNNRGGGGVAIRRDSSMLAVNALAQLGSSTPTHTPTNVCSPEANLQPAPSPVRKRQSLLAPWKK